LAFANLKFSISSMRSKS